LGIGECCTKVAVPSFDCDTILIVDDDIDVRRSLSDFLEDEGYSVAAASNGRIALDLLRGGVRPALILLDLMMPGMDGWDFRQAQLEDPALASVPVVIVTASGFSAEAINRQFAPAAFVSKPIQPTMLLEAIDRSLRDLRRPAQTA
jgi:two-component system chemotaxis response regulator CheY